MGPSFPKMSTAGSDEVEKKVKKMEQYLPFSRLNLKTNAKDDILTSDRPREMRKWKDHLGTAAKCVDDNGETRAPIPKKENPFDEELRLCSS